MMPEGVACYTRQSTTIEAIWFIGFENKKQRSNLQESSKSIGVFPWAIFFRGVKINFVDVNHINENKIALTSKTKT